MRNVRQRGLVVCALVVVATTSTACWSEDGWDSSRTMNDMFESTLNNTNVTGLTPHWTTPNEQQGAPATGTGAAYDVGFVPGGTGPIPMLFAYDEATGTPIWSTPLGPADLNWVTTSADSPAVGNAAYGGAGLVFADVSQYPGTSDGLNSEVVAVDASSGVIVWNR